MFLMLVGVMGGALDIEVATLIASCNTVVGYIHDGEYHKLRCVPKEELKTMYNNVPCTVWGCTVTTATNYSPTANTDDGSCTVWGCTVTTAANYNPTATTDDGSCTACADSATFADAFGSPCTDWDPAHREGQTCAEAGAAWGYSTDQLDEVVAACPQMCGGCT